MDPFDDALLSEARQLVRGDAECGGACRPEHAEDEALSLESVVTAGSLGILHCSRVLAAKRWPGEGRMREEPCWYAPRDSNPEPND